MKKIEAIIRTTKFDAVQDALASIGVRFFTLTEVRGCGLQTGAKRTYRGADLGANFIPRLQMDVVTTEDKLDLIIGTIEKAARTGAVGDGKIFVYDIDRALRIRTGERDKDAV